MANRTNQSRIKKDSSRPIYFKSFKAQDVTVSTDVRKISGYAAIWGNVDSDGDVLIKGCAAKSIQERGPESNTNRKIIFLWMHCMDEPLGRITVLKEDDKGLYFEAEVDQIPEGDRALTQLKSGTLNQFSIGFQYVWDKCEWTEMPDPDDPGQTIYAFIVKEINLFEISVVSLGANEETEFTGMKSAEIESHKNKLLRETDKVLKSLPYDTQLQIRQLIAKHISLAEIEPTDSLKGNSKPDEGLTIDWFTLSQAFKD